MTFRFPGATPSLLLETLAMETQLTSVPVATEFFMIYDWRIRLTLAGAQSCDCSRRTETDAYLPALCSDIERLVPPLLQPRRSLPTPVI